MSQKIAVFASGEGTNAERLIKYFENTKTPVAIVVTNNSKAGVVVRAGKYGVPVLQITKQELADIDCFFKMIEKHRVTWIVLAGFLLKIPSYLVQRFPNKIINIHPSLLPKFGGKGMYGNHVHKAVLEAGEKESGITIHFVNEHYDEGAIIFQATCVIEETDTVESLSKKIHALEYFHFPKVVEEVINKAIWE